MDTSDERARPSDADRGSGDGLATAHAGRANEHPAWADLDSAARKARF
jgi:hypothetical protein